MNNLRSKLIQVTDTTKINSRRKKNILMENVWHPKQKRHKSMTYMSTELNNGTKIVIKPVYLFIYLKDLPVI